MACAERLRQILGEPLEYLHPQRLELPAGFDNPGARCALNRILLEGSDLSAPWPCNGVAQQWIRQWRQLPYIARLMGAWRLFPQLARGGAVQRLPASLLQFAGCRPAPRACLPLERSCAPLQLVDAAGYHALVGLSGFVSSPLLERLRLQFAADVIDRQAQWPLAAADTTLFFLAVQHARHYPNPQ